MVASVIRRLPCSRAPSAPETDSGVGRPEPTACGRRDAAWFRLDIDGGNYTVVGSQRTATTVLRLSRLLLSTINRHARPPAGLRSAFNAASMAVRLDLQAPDDGAGDLDFANPRLICGVAQALLGLGDADAVPGDQYAHRLIYDRGVS